MPENRRLMIGWTPWLGTLRATMGDVQIGAIHQIGDKFMAHFYMPSRMGGARLGPTYHKTSVEAKKMIESRMGIWLDDLGVIQR